MTRLQFHQGGKATFSNTISQSCFDHLHLGKPLSTESVPTAIERQILASLFKLGNIVSSIPLVSNSFNCLHIVLCFFGKEVAKSFPFCMEFTRS